LEHLKGYGNNQQKSDQDKALVKYENVKKTNFGYGSINKLNLSIPGEKEALIGRSGSRITTIISMLMTLE
jgi:ABC-type proline/glycine betaine transport system ATPase subunit